MILMILGYKKYESVASQYLGGLYPKDATIYTPKKVRPKLFRKIKWGLQNRTIFQFCVYKIECSGEIEKNGVT